MIIITGYVSDNYFFFKLRGSKLTWKLYLLSSRGSPQGPIKYHESQNIHILLTAACHMIRLFSSLQLKKAQTTKTPSELFPAVQATFAHNVFTTRLAVTHWPKFWRILAISNAYSSNLMCLSETLDANRVHMAFISHVTDAQLYIIINTFLWKRQTVVQFLITHDLMVWSNWTILSAPYQSLSQSHPEPLQTLFCKWWQLKENNTDTMETHTHTHTHTHTDRVMQKWKHTHMNTHTVEVHAHTHHHTHTHTYT